MDLSASCARDTDHPRAIAGSARADPSHRLEGASPTVVALSQAGCSWQIGTEGNRRRRPRACRVYLGDRAARRAKGRDHRRAQGGMTPEWINTSRGDKPAAETSVPNAGDRAWRVGSPRIHGFEAGIAFALIADTTTHARSLDRGSPATNLGHAVPNPRIRAGSTVVPSSCRLPWASINCNAAQADRRRAPRR